jgi:hypothetical protein
MKRVATGILVKDGKVLIARRKQGQNRGTVALKRLDSRFRGNDIQRVLQLVNWF